MEEDGHLMPLSLRLSRLLAMPILRMACASLDRLGLSSAVIAAGLTPPCSGVLAALLGAFGFSRAALGLTRGDVWEGHRPVFLQYISRGAG